MYSADLVYKTSFVYIQQMMHIGQDVALLSFLTASLCHSNNEEKSWYESILNLRTEFLKV